MSKRQTRKFCSTRTYLIEDNRLIEITSGESFPINPMKTQLIASLCSVLLALTSFGQTPPPAPPNAPPANRPPGAPPITGMGPAAVNPAIPPAPAASVAGTNPVAPASTAPGISPVAGMSPSTAAMSPATTTTTTTTAATATPTPTPASTESGGVLDKNFFVDNFKKGGPIMWPILVVSLTALAVVLERIFWWLGRWMRRDPKRIEKVFTAIEVGDVAEASRLSRDSRDPVLRMMWNGLNHQHASLQGALQVAAGIEIKRAGRFLVVMDTLVTLAPLLGLLGTITGLIKSFAFLGNEELAIQA